MCGIAGFITHNPQAPVDRETLRRMTSSLAHRGPDADGHWVDDAAGVALGHRRLSIVDLSPTGHQPMVSASERYVITFNGEIYNFTDLRRELDGPFRGHSDTEVILAAVEAWGLEAAVRRFVGMFAFALWDRHERTLHLVRDRMGEKPLYYGRMGDTFMFASELKALRAHPRFIGEVDRNSMALQLRHNYIGSPYSIYQGVFKLPPGTILTLRPDTLDAPVAPVAYWSMREAAEQGLRARLELSEGEAVDALESLLKDAIGRQMMADVPLGAFLSGGIDSSTVVALMQAQSSRPIKTFTIGFHEAGYNEAVHAKAVAQHLGTDHTELYVTHEDALAVIPRLPSLYDEPFSDSSQIPTFLVAQLARQHVTVSLSGDGGDELFAGYNRYFWAREIWRRLNRLPPAARRAAADAIRTLPADTWNRLLGGVARSLPGKLRLQTPGDKLYKLADVLAVPSPEAMYRRLVSHWQAPEQLVLGASEPDTGLTDRSRWADLPDFTERMMYLDAISYLPGDILTKVDRASMGVSLESRVPFLDHRVVEFAWRVPLDLKVRGAEGKWLLRQVLYRHVPRELVERPKVGFGVPIDQWLRGPLREWAEELLTERRLRDEGYFHPAPIRLKWEEHLSGKRNWQYDLWDVLMFQAWLQEQQPSKLLV